MNTLFLIDLIDRIAWFGALGMVIVALVYALTLIVISRRRPRRSADERQVVFDPGMHIIVLMPCLNEAEVIAASVQRLLDINDPGLHVMVVDDGSDDGTGDVVESIGDPRAEVLRRILPNARKGKGEETAAEPLAEWERELLEGEVKAAEAAAAQAAEESAPKQD